VSSGPCLFYIVTGQLWSISTTTIQVRFRVQLNTVLFAKTLVRKDVASSSGTSPTADNGKDKPKSADIEKEEEADFSSKAQIMTLMTTDVDRVSEFAFHYFTLIGPSTFAHSCYRMSYLGTDAPLEIFIGTIFLYNLLGVSAFVGLAMSCLFLPLNSLAGKVIVSAQDNLMKARDERVSVRILAIY
jgi:hypothetical protein